MKLSIAVISLLHIGHLHRYTWRRIRTQWSCMKQQKLFNIDSSTMPLATIERSAISVAESVHTAGAETASLPTGDAT